MSFAAFGGPDVLELGEVPAPEAGDGQVRVAVRAVGVNPMDIKIRSGGMERLFPTPLPSTPGSEVAGVVDQVGDGVSGVAVGDEVLGWSATGACAEHALLGVFAGKPATMPWDQAAALPVAGETSRRILDAIDLQKGETVLVHGGAGGVGTVLVQLARELGARVIATAGEANHDYLRSLGAEPVIYGDGLVDRVRAVAPDGVDAAVDVAGRDALDASIALTGGTDRVVTIADGRAREIGVRFLMGRPDDRDAAALAELAERWAGGGLKLVTTTFPLDDVAEAHAVSAAGHVRGKLVLLIG
nr:NADP-dependent oxidoreductase [Baekduia alba]